jgi:hypothetical protein
MAEVHLTAFQMQTSCCGLGLGLGEVKTKDGRKKGRRRERSEKEPVRYIPGLGIIMPDLESDEIVFLDKIEI